MTNGRSVVELGGHDVHRVGFGAMQLPGKGVFGPPADRDEALAVLRRAVDAGVDHIDTAQFYGPDVSNELIREALHPYPENLVIVSKVGAARDANGGWVAAQKPTELRAGIEANLKSLGIETVPVVNLRRHPESDVAFEDQLQAMTEARDAGLIGDVGLSNVTVGEYRTAKESTRVACVQNAYSVVFRDEQEMFDECARDGVPFVPYFPLGSAFHPVNPVLASPEVVAIAKRLGATSAQVVLAWLLAKAPKVLLIPGTSKVSHLDENIGVMDVELDNDALGALDRLGDAEGEGAV